jgi:hypothetical protein
MPVSRRTLAITNPKKVALSAVVVDQPNHVISWLEQPPAVRKVSELGRSSLNLRAMKPAVLAIASALLVLTRALAAEELVSASPTRPPSSAKVLAKLPKYAPVSTGTPVDRREIDRPRNAIVRLSKDLLPPEAVIASAAPTEDNGRAPEGVVRLPRYTVGGRRIPKFKEREILTPTARIDLYLKRHPGLRVGNLFGLNRGIAAAMIAEEDEIDRRREMNDLLEFQAFANSLPPPDESRDSNESDTAAPTP